MQTDLTKKKIFLSRKKRLELAKRFNVSDYTVGYALTYVDIKKGHNNHTAREMRCIAMKEMGGVMLEED